MDYVRAAQNNKSVTFNCAPNYFYFVLWAKLAGTSAQSYGKGSFFSVFSRLDHFPQVFRQFNEWPILKLNEMIRVPHLVLCQIAFILFCDREW